MRSSGRRAGELPACSHHRPPSLGDIHSSPRPQRALHARMFAPPCSLFARRWYRVPHSPWQVSSALCTSALQTIAGANDTLSERCACWSDGVCTVRAWWRAWAASLCSGRIGTRAHCAPISHVCGAGDCCGHIFCEQVGCYGYRMHRWRGFTCVERPRSPNYGFLSKCRQNWVKEPNVDERVE